VSTVPEICKLPRPTSASFGSVQPHTFAYLSMCPDTLRGLDRKATHTLLKLLITTLNRDFSTNLDPEKILSGSWAAKADFSHEEDSEMETAVTANNKHIVLIGASNMKIIAPLLFASGFTVTDLTYPS
jgi:hypothetical protein